MRIRQLVSGRDWYPKNEFCFTIYDEDECSKGLAESCYISEDGIEDGKLTYVLISKEDAKTIYEENP
jgi:hypothetical protein